MKTVKKYIYIYSQVHCPTPIVQTSILTSIVTTPIVHRHFSRHLSNVHLFWGQ